MQFLKQLKIAFELIVGVNPKLPMEIEVLVLCPALEAVCSGLITHPLKKNLPVPQDFKLLGPASRYYSNATHLNICDGVHNCPCKWE